jgi:hypothetical protein
MFDQEKSRQEGTNPFAAISNRKTLLSLTSLCVIAALALILRLLTAAQAAEAVWAPQAQPTISPRPQQTIDWAKQFGSPQIDARHNDFDRNGDMTIHVGGIYVVGNTEGTVDPQNPFQGVTDVWLAKYNTAGHLQWIRQLGTSDEDRVTEVIKNRSGEIFLGGYTRGAFPGKVNQGNYDFWVAKYDSSGVFQWISQDGTLGQDGKFGLAIAPDGSGGGKLVTFTAERTQLSTYSFNSNGVFSTQSVSGLPQQFRNTPYDLALGPDNSVYVAGELTNGGVVPPIKNRYVIKFDNQGNPMDVDTRLTGIDESARRVAVDAEGNVYVAGVTRAGDAWVNKYNADGSRAWIRNLASAGVDVINAIETSSARGYIVVAGMTTGTLGEANPDNREDAWFARLRIREGGVTLLQQFPKAGNDGFNALAIGGCDSILLAGYTANFVRNIGAQDALLMRYAYTISGGMFPPFISTITPGSGRVGDPVAISYGNLFGITGVYFNGMEAAIVGWVPNTSILVRVPQGATTGPVTITTNCIHVDSSTPFTVLP